MELVLKPAQQEVVDKIEGKSKVGLFLDTAFGKTLIALYHMQRLDYKKILIVCPKSVLDKHNWEKENEKFEFGLEFDVINFESIHKVDVTLYDSIIVDESHRIKNRNSKAFKAINKGKYENVILLSATPIDLANGEYYSQMMLLDLLDPVEYRRYLSFEERYCVYETEKQFGRFFKTFKGNINDEELQERLSKCCVFKKKDEVLDTSHSIIKHTYSKDKKYNKALKNRGFILENPTEELDIDDVFLLDNVSLKFTFARLALCGAYKDIFTFDSKKNVLLQSLVQKYNNQPLVIFYNFDNELKAILKVLDEESREVVLVNGAAKEFSKIDENKNQVIVIQLQSGSTGIDGLQYISQVIYYSPPTSSITFEQSLGRVDRHGQENHIYYHTLVAANSVEEEIYEALQNKQDYKAKFFKG